MRFRDHLQYLSVDKMITVKMDHTEILSEYVSWLIWRRTGLSRHTVKKIKVS